MRVKLCLDNVYSQISAGGLGAGFECNAGSGGMLRRTGL